MRKLNSSGLSVQNEYHPALSQGFQGYIRLLVTKMQVMYFVVPPKSVTTCMSTIPGAAICVATRPFSKSSIVSISNARQCFCIRYFLGNTPHTHIYALLCPHVPDSMPLSRMK